tara:strand:- start:2061 stop:2597 length:537 start_codon:yes stop_codon:yes gene_type:complete
MDIDQFIVDCKVALNDGIPTKAVREVVAHAVSDERAAIKALGIPQQGGVQKIYVSDELTILNIVWAPGLEIMPHNHNMWAVIGIYSGREDNVFWRRLKDDGKGRIEEAGAKSLGPTDVTTLGKNIIHSVSNPTSGFTGAIHVYGGDFFKMHRSEWDIHALEEQPYDIEKNMKLFEAAN